MSSGGNHTVSPDPERTRALATEYERLREELTHLSSAPVPDLVAIDKCMALLDEVHAAFKAEQGGVAAEDHQRY